MTRYVVLVIEDHPIYPDESPADIMASLRMPVDAYSDVGMDVVDAFEVDDQGNRIEETA